jgi:GDYXXLXY protein
MKLAPALAVIAALAFPILALAALIGQQERLLSGATVLNVPVSGVDPRDPLRGRYIVAQFDWDWSEEPIAPTRFAVLSGAVCVLTDDQARDQARSPARPRVRFLAGWKAGDGSGDDCRLIIKGRGWPKETGLPARFAPESLDAGGGLVHLFVPEDRASELERLLRARPGGLTVDLAVRPDGLAAIKALRFDGQLLAR